MISKFVLLIWIDCGNFINLVVNIGRIEIMVKKIEFIKVKWYKILVIYFLVCLLGLIFGI